jgi:multiple sugar transport system ATP-binding protein
VQMRVEIAKLHQDLGNTMIYVTHDQVEAMTMADKIVVLRDGLVMQAGTPLDLYNKPANQFVAGFIGSPKMNFLAARAGASSDMIEVAGSRLRLPAVLGPAGPDAPLTFGVRPEHIIVGGEAGEALGEVKVQLVEHLGGETVLYTTTAGGENLTVSAAGQLRIHPGENVPLRVDPAICHVFDREGTALRS